MAPAPETAAQSHADELPRSARKRTAILDAATTVFLRNGYLGTSMDEIAALAGVSKQTVYKHFTDKESLFTEIVTTTVEEAGDPALGESLELEDGDLETSLQELARRLLAGALQPKVLQLRRLVIGEVGRFPELGRAFYESGFGRTVAALAPALEQLAARGALNIADPELAATHFSWLVLSAPVGRATLLGDDAIPSRAELKRYADGGVRTFLAAYGRGGD